MPSKTFLLLILLAHRARSRLFTVNQSVSKSKHIHIAPYVGTGTNLRRKSESFNALYRLPTYLPAYLHVVWLIMCFVLVLHWVWELRQVVIFLLFRMHTSSRSCRCVTMRIKWTVSWLASCHCLLTLTRTTAPTPRLTYCCKRTSATFHCHRLTTTPIPSPSWTKCFVYSRYVTIIIIIIKLKKK